MLVWCLVVVEIEDPDWLLKHVLKLVYKGAQARLALVVYHDNYPRSLCTGTPTLETVTKLASALPKIERSSKSEQPCDITEFVARQIRQCGGNQHFDLHFSYIAKFQPHDSPQAPAFYPKCSLEKCVIPNMRSFSSLQNSRFLFSAPGAFEGEIIIGDLKLPMKGYSILKDTQPPSEMLFHGASLVRPHTIFPSLISKEAYFEYGRTRVPMTNELQHQLKKGRRATHAPPTVEVCGFVNPPPIYMVGEPVTYLQIDKNKGGGDSLAYAMHKRGKNAIARFQRGRGSPEMVVLSPVPTEKDAYSLLMQPLPTAQDMHCAPHFPALEKQPPHSIFDALVNNLAEMSGEKLGSSDPGISNPQGGIYGANPLSDRIYSSILGQVLDERMNALQSAIESTSQNVSQPGQNPLETSVMIRAGVIRDSEVDMDLDVEMKD